MSSFKVPISVCDKLDALTRKFWWKPKEKDGKFLAWRAWDKLCASKATGGLGFKRAKYNNNALLSKLAWMVTSKQDNHLWVPWLPTFKPKPKNEASASSHLMVSQLIDHAQHAWRSNMVLELFDHESVKAILSIPIPIRS